MSSTAPPPRAPSPGPTSYHDDPTAQAHGRATRALRVTAPGRLHLGFLDPSASLGRRYGSLGWVIDGPATVVELRAAASTESLATRGADVDPAELTRAAQHLRAMQHATGLDTPLQLHLPLALPAHAGFGSGTQLALAVGRGFCAWHRLTLSTPEIARVLGRGLRSGIGIAGFDAGGLLLDGGPGADGSPAPLLARVEPPQDWRIVLVLDRGSQGLNGSDEKHAIANLPAFSQADAAAVCHEVLMRVLAGAASADFAAFSAGVARVQALVGAHFAPAQAGRLFASAAVERACDWLAQQRGLATGQTSWGPTGFALLPSQAQADEAVTALRASGELAAGLDLLVVAPRQRGALIEEPQIAPVTA